MRNLFRRKIKLKPIFSRIASAGNKAPNVVYHAANNYENKLDLYLPANPGGPTPVLLMIHGGGWVAGTKEGQLLRALPYLEMGWAVVNATYRLYQGLQRRLKIAYVRCNGSLAMPSATTLTSRVS